VVTSAPDGIPAGRVPDAGGSLIHGGAGSWMARPLGLAERQLVERRVVVGELDGETAAELLSGLVLQRLLVDELPAERGDVVPAPMRLLEHAGQSGPVALGGEAGVEFPGQLEPPAGRLVLRGHLGCDSRARNSRMAVS
jgi:hypothetical protein